jgi:nicotinamidase/pyrazinamidase
MGAAEIYLNSSQPDAGVRGLTTDSCVAWTAIDARHAGLNAFVVEDACRCIDAGGSLAKAWSDMAKAGVKKIQSSDLAV